MRLKNNLFLIGFVLVAFPSLNSCETNSSTTEVYINLTSTPSAISTSTYTSTPTERPFINPLGKLIFVRDSVVADATSPHDIVFLDLETEESFPVLDKDQELNGQTISLSYPNITWSPDGHWIAFVGKDFSKAFWLYEYEDIYIVKSDGTELRRLKHSPRYNKRDIAWSPNGEYILAAMGINGSDLYLIDTVTGEIHKRLTSNGNNYAAIWSPDGEKIAYLADTDLLIMDVDNKISQRIDIFSNYRIQEFSWSRNNEQIIFSAFLENSNCADIFLLNLNTDIVTNITSSNYSERFPDWLPDGKHFVFSRTVYDCDVTNGQIDWDIYITNLYGEEHKLVADVANMAKVAPVPNLQIGNQYIITNLGEQLNLRSEPSLNGNILRKLHAGEVITVLEGYIDADNYYWWKIQTQDSLEGWVAELASWYKPLNE